MLRNGLRASVLVLILAQLSLAQATVEELKKVVRQTVAAAAKTVAETLPATEPRPCVAVDVLIACVAFDAKGQMKLAKEGAEPEVNRAGTIGPSLAAKLNEERGKLPPGISPGTAGADLLLEGLADAKRLQSLARLQLLIPLGGKEAFAQAGHRQPRITGAATTTVAGRPARTNNVTLENVGTLVSGSAVQAANGKIGLTLKMERSAVGPEEEGEVIGVIEGRELRTPAIDTLTIDSQITAADGQSVVLGDVVETWTGGVKETFVIVTPTVVK